MRDFLFLDPMAKNAKYDVLIIGGGLAGLTTALHLSQTNCRICLIEKNEFPHHKVCGEYVSNEVLSYLNSLGIDPLAVGAKKIDNFQITNTAGHLLSARLPLGGFGISRYLFDLLLFEAVEKKVDIIFDTVEKVVFESGRFSVYTQRSGTVEAQFVIGAFGKRSNLDTYLKRSFIQQKSPWLAVKAHYDCDFPDDTVALHNFNGGYCGLSRTETNAVNVCYLATFNSFKKHSGIDGFQKEELSKNPYLRSFFQEAKPLFEKPLAISQISFQKKKTVENHIFMLGDSAGLIHPLCGNGMAMAIRSAQIFSTLFIQALKEEDFSRNKLERDYETHWATEFSKRLRTGRLVQRALMNNTVSKVGFAVMRMMPSILPKIIEKTHGSPK